jgi:transposase
VPFAREAVVLTKQEHIELIWEASHFKTLHKSALAREARLKKQLEHEKAKVRHLNQRLYGKSTESAKKNEKLCPDNLKEAVRPRGQQVGSNGHGRTPRPELPVTVEILDVADDDKFCIDCGLHRPDLEETEDAKIVEVEVKAHVRHVKRKKYGSCGCKDKKGIITAPPAPRVLNRSDIGVSVWVEILLDKYLSTQATHRLLTSFGYLGYPLAQGTVTDGLKRLSPLFKPLVKAMLDKHLSERLFHADESHWRVNEKIEGKEGNRWYLWLIQSTSVVFYKMAPGRDAGVPTEHFRDLEESKLTVFLVCDRYSAYKKLVKNIPIIVLAFCWAHVRRDYLDAARSWPALEEWMFSWVNDIGELYHINNERVKHWDEDKPLGKQSKAFKQHQRRLLKKLSGMKARCDACLSQETLHDVQRAVLASLDDHWSGLILFAKHPQIKMDNNTAERSIRNPVTGRKRYYGSGSVWSAELAAFMFTILQTLILWGINPRHWLTCYLTACAENGGSAPADLSPFLPWDMTESRLQSLCLAAPMTGVDEAQLIQDSG